MAAKAEDLCTIIATIPTGLEKGAAHECEEVLRRSGVVSDRGKIIFPLHCVEELSKVDALRSIENFCVLVKELPDFCKEESTVLERLVDLPFETSINWATPLSAWRHYQRISSASSSASQVVQDIVGAQIDFWRSSREAKESDESISTSVIDGGAAQELMNTSKKFKIGDNDTPSSDDRSRSILSDRNTVTFRVTCVRGGKKHGFTSMEAACQLGAGLVKLFGWKPKMKNYDIEVLLNIHGDEAKIFIALSKESKSKRNITHFGPTTLKSVIAYGMLRLANIQPGDVVVDPMCGGGSVSIEGSLAWPSSYHVLGDIYDQAPTRAMANCVDVKASGAGSGLKTDILQWDVRNLPLRTASVDVVVTDLPFGKKSGRKIDNRELYPQALEELGRVSRPNTSRAVLLTHDNRTMSKALVSSRLWKRQLTKWINIGGLKAAIFILHRTHL